MTDSVVDCKTEVKQATKYVKETENVAEKYSAMTVSKNSSDVNMNVGEMPSAAFTAVPTLKSVKKVRNDARHQSLPLGKETVLAVGRHLWSGRTICTAVKYYYSKGRLCTVFPVLVQHLHFYPYVDSREVNGPFTALMDVMLQQQHTYSYCDNHPTDGSPQENLYLPLKVATLRLRIWGSKASRKALLLCLICLIIGFTMLLLR